MEVIVKEKNKRNILSVTFWTRKHRNGSPSTTNVVLLVLVRPIAVVVVIRFSIP